MAWAAVGGVGLLQVQILLTCALGLMEVIEFSPSRGSGCLDFQRELDELEARHRAITGKNGIGRQEMLAVKSKIGSVVDRAHR